jgi:hypothetical protein
LYVWVVLRHERRRIVLNSSSDFSPKNAHGLTKLDSLREVLKGWRALIEGSVWRTLRRKCPSEALLSAQPERMPFMTALKLRCPLESHDR